VVRGRGIGRVVCVYAVGVFGSVEEGRVITFSSLILATLLLVFSSLSNTSGVLQVFREKNTAALLIACIAILLLSIFIKPISALFEFGKSAFARYWVVFVGGLLFFILERLFCSTLFAWGIVLVRLSPF